MATQKQVEFYESLCEQLGQDSDDDFDSLSIDEASKHLTELVDMVAELNNDNEPYYYD